MTLTYFCDIDKHLKENFQNAISRRLLAYSYSDVIVQSYSSECS